MWQKSLVGPRDGVASPEGRVILRARSVFRSERPILSGYIVSTGFCSKHHQSSKQKNQLQGRDSFVKVCSNTQNCVSAKLLQK